MWINFVRGVHNYLPVSTHLLRNLLFYVSINLYKCKKAVYVGILPKSLSTIIHTYSSFKTLVYA